MNLTPKPSATSRLPWRASKRSNVEAADLPQGARLAPLANPTPDASRRLNRGPGPAKNSRFVTRSPRCPIRAGECAALVAEKFAARKFRDDRRAIGNNQVAFVRPRV